MLLTTLGNLGAIINLVGWVSVPLQKPSCTTKADLQPTDHLEIDRLFAFFFLIHWSINQALFLTMSFLFLVGDHFFFLFPSILCISP